MMNEALIEIRDLLETAIGSGVTTYYAGDVGLPYKNALPAIIVRELETVIDRPSTAKDRYKHSISILVVMDMMKAMDMTGLSNNISNTRQDLRKLVEEADTDGAPKTTTVLGALMKHANIRGTNYMYTLPLRVNYNPSFPTEFFYVAAEITLEAVTEMVTRKA